MSENNKPNLNTFNKGLHLDNSHIDQPKGTYRFTLNSVNETELGDSGFIGNEESNEICGTLTEGYIPIGKCYMEDNNLVIFSVSEDGQSSEIGILNNNCEYVVQVNDTTSSLEDKLNFKITNQIQAIYRLRRGCERTIYFTDNLNKPRYFNFDKAQNFKNNDGTWKAQKFNLQKTYTKVPIFQNIEVLDSGGNLEPGSYNIAVQYIDENLNTTEWVTTSNIIKIYNDLSSKTYREINGSINSDIDYLNFPKTGKAIKVELSNLDNSFLYYRLAIVESNVGTGIPNRVIYSESIPITKNFYIYTGTNGLEEGSKEELLAFTDVIDKAGSIEQIENRLLLGNTEGKQINYCKLQKYASEIKADCITKEIVLNNINDPANPKNPIQDLDGVGYMPGEIYSFGIVYVFEDGTVSPTYHIPGKNNNIDPKTVFTPGENVFPMSNQNTSQNTTYNENNSCGTQSFWGRDSEGEPLKGKFVRHHRFPLRSEINKPLITETLGQSQEATYYQVVLKVTGRLKVPKPCLEDNPTCGTDKFNTFDIRVTYKVDGQTFSFIQSINPATFSNGTNDEYEIELYQNSQYHSSNNITDIVIEETDINGIYYPQYSQWVEYFNAQPTYTTNVNTITNTIQGKIVKTEILGIKFSNIKLPSLEDTNNNKIVGYYIVRNERTEFDKTILDSGVLIPSLENSKYISHGLLQPESTNLSTSVYGLIHPEHKFLNKEYLVYDKIIQQGNFKVTDRKYGKINYDDVYDGSSFNKDKQKEGNDDGQTSDGSPKSRGYDGWSLNIISRDNILSFESKSDFEINTTNIKEKFYLDALGDKSINDNANDVYNISSDNKVGFIQLDNSITINPENNLPYVVFYKNNSDPYSNFRVLPYYKESNNINLFNNDTVSECNIFNGDSYVAPMRYVNTVFWDNRIALRAGKTNALKKVVGAFLVILGAILSIVPGVNLSSTLIIGAGIALIGAGTLFISSGIKQDNFNKAYNEEYDKGLRQTTLDNWVNTFYNYTADVPNYFPVPWAEQVQHASNHAKSGPSDDSIQWIGDCLTDLWFETSINTNLRNHFVNDVSPTYLDSPGRIEEGNNEPIGLWEFFGLHYADSNWQRYPKSSLEKHLVRKLLAFDQTRDDNKLYIGVPLGEYYNINLDYLRKNKEKIYYHLPLEYDCCSECNEKFPHRIYYSEQSFQEELTDNYRVFLSNNYKDIEGETGEIVNIFRYFNSLYIHTKEALWLLPRNYQERVTDQIVSFIGTGSYFEIPPQKMLDSSTGLSAGLKHKWSLIKTPEGVFFPSEQQKEIYQFDGKQLKSISSLGINSWFKQNLEVISDKLYKDNIGLEYLYNDNTSNPLGTGYITSYDSIKKRVIFTKKDIKLKSEYYDSNNTFYIKNNTAVVFYDLANIINTEASNGWTYLGIENAKMKFYKDVIKTRKEIRYVEGNTFKNVDYLVFRYNFTNENGRDLDTRTELISPVARGPIGFGRNINYDSQYLRWGGDNTGYGVECILIDLKKIKEDFPTTTDVVFKCGAWWYGERVDGNMNMNAEGYKGGVMNLDSPNYNFVNSGGILQGTYSFQTVNIQIPPSGGPGINDANFQPYNDIGLFTYNIERGELSWNGISGGEIPNEISYIEVEVDVEYVEREYKYISGEEKPIQDLIDVDNSWTLSYSLRRSYWIGWHSYIPNMYLNTSDKFYSYISTNNNIWRHNTRGSYQTYYGVYYPHILEYVSLSSPIVTRIWESLILQTDVKTFDSTLLEYIDEKDITFNKIILYNSRQCSGVLDLIVKNLDSSSDYLFNQIDNSNKTQSIIDRREKDWFINNFRDIRVDYTKPIWISNKTLMNSNSYIDKVLNEVTLDFNKDWYELESFRDKYLVVRLIFDKFANKKIITNFSVENEDPSLH